MPRSVFIALTLALTPMPALAADHPAAAGCSGRLGPLAKHIYDMVAPEVTPASVIKDIIVEKMRPLVMAGKYPRDEARAAGQSAGECLRYLK